MHDHYEDRDARELAAFANVIELPDFVKTAELVDDADLDGLGHTAFADRRNRKFPVHTKKDAWMSRLWFTKNKGLYKSAHEAAEVEANIRHAAEVWGLDDSYRATMPPAIEKTASAGLSVDMPGVDGQTIGRLNLGSSPRDFERQAIQIFEKKAMFTRRQRKVAAEALLKSSMDQSALSRDVLEFLEKAAGEGVCDPATAMLAIKDRLTIVGDGSEASEMLAKIAEELHGSGFDAEYMDKAADALDVVDRVSGLHRHYGVLPLPEEVFCHYTRGMAKRAADEVVPLQNGVEIPKAKLKEGDIDQFCSDVMGEPVAGDHEEKIAALAALPAPDADLLCEWLSKKAEDIPGLDELSEEERERRIQAAKAGLFGGALSGVVSGAVANTAEHPKNVLAKSALAALLAGPIVGAAEYHMMGDRR